MDQQSYESSESEKSDTEYNWEILNHQELVRIKRMMNSFAPAKTEEKERVPIWIEAQPKVSQDAKKIEELVKKQSHLWVMIHDYPPEQLIKSQEYKKMEKMYQWSKYLKKRFACTPNTISNLKADIFKFNTPIKVFVWANIIFEDDKWIKIKEYLRDKCIDEIIVKAEMKFDNKMKEFCDKRLKSYEHYSGYVSDFSEALQLQMKILNLMIKELKPNFLILNKLDEAEAALSADSFHDVLINTKAYLKESLSIRTQEEALKALITFEQYIKKQVDEHYRLLSMKTFMNQEELKQKQIRQKIIIDQYFDKFRLVISKSYPFTQQNRLVEEEFYRDMVHLYTKETQVYRSVNMLCKSTTNRETFMKISFFCKFLNQAIKFFFKKNIGKKSKHSFMKTLYRGTYVSATEWNELTQGQNEYVLNLAFMSTSKKQEVASQFSNKLKNNVIIQISFHKDFYSKSIQERYTNYIEFLIDINSDVMGTSNENEQEILFNCFNVFKILGYRDDEKGKILMLQYCSHIEIIKKKEDKLPLTALEEKILNTIVRLEKEKDFADHLLEQGKTTQIAEYYQKIIDNGVDLRTHQAENYIKICCETGNLESAQNYIEMVKQKNEITYETEMKIAVYQTICQQHIEAEEILQRSNTQSINRTSIAEVLESWKDLFDKIQIKFYLAKSKQNLGCYQQCISLLEESIQIVDQEIIVMEIRQHIEIWKLLFDYMHKQLQNQVIIQHYKLFEDIYKEIKSQQRKQKQLNKLIKQLLNPQFLVNWHLAINSKIRIQQIKVEWIRDYQKYKECFYKRSNFEATVLIYYYQTLIKSERIKHQADSNYHSDQSNNKFLTFFTNYKKFFESIYKIYNKQNNSKLQFDKAKFYNNFIIFITSYCNFYHQNNNDKEKEEKSNLLIIRSRLFTEAKRILNDINENHEELPNIYSTEEKILADSLYTQQEHKINSLACSLGKKITGKEAERNRDQEERFNTAKQILAIANKRASIHQINKSVLNENACINSQMQATFEILSMSSTVVKDKQIWISQAHKLDAKLEANICNVSFLKTHSSNAFNQYLRAMLYFHKGHYEASMIFIGKSEEILHQIKKKNQQSKRFQELSEDERKKLENKISNMIENNEIKIKICLLKSQICVNYKPSLYKDCFSEISSQVKFIQTQMFEYNSSLPQLYYNMALLIYQNQQNSRASYFGSITVEECLGKARKIITENFGENNNLQILKILSLLYSVTPNPQSRSDILQEFETMADKFKISVEKLSSQQFKQNLLQYYCLYALVEMSRLTVVQQKDHRSLQISTCWQIIHSIIDFKYKKHIPLLLKEIRLEFSYCGYLFTIDNFQQGLKKLTFVVERLQICENFLNEDIKNYGLKIDAMDKNIILETYNYAIKMGIENSKKKPKLAANNDEIYSLQTFKQLEEEFFTKYTFYK